MLYGIFHIFCKHVNILQNFLQPFILSTVESAIRSPSVEEAATSSPVAERWVILSEITFVASRIFWIFSSAVWISSIRRSTVSPTLPNFSRVFSISSFCFSTEATEFSILSLARFVSSFNLSIISVMLAEAFFVSVRKAGGFHRPPQQTLFRLPRHAQPQWKHLRQADLSGWKFQ